MASKKQQHGESKAPRRIKQQTADTAREKSVNEPVQNHAPDQAHAESNLLTSHKILHLQRNIGNHAVGRMIKQLKQNEQGEVTSKPLSVTQSKIEQKPNVNVSPQAISSVQTKTDDIENVTPELIGKYWGTTSRIARAIRRYNAIDNESENYDEQLRILDNIVLLLDRWTQRHEADDDARSIGIAVEIETIRFRIDEERAGIENARFESSKDYSTKENIREHIALILQQAATNFGLDDELLATEENISSLLPLLFLGFEKREAHEAIDAGLHNQPTTREVLGPVSDRIRAGAIDLAAALVHWRLQLSDGEPVVIQQVSLKGSDLHERGLGAAMVTFQKGEQIIEKVLKPDNREIEAALFGTQADSLASQINEHILKGKGKEEEESSAGMDEGSGKDKSEDEGSGKGKGEAEEAEPSAGMEEESGKLATFGMAIDEQHGAMIDKVEGQPLREKVGNEMMIKGGSEGFGTVDNPSVLETIALSYLTGLKDLHYENVLYNDEGQPYLIDADNALIPEIIEGGKSDLDTGFLHEDAETSAERTKLAEGNFSDSRSKIIQSILSVHDVDNHPIWELIRSTFDGKKGVSFP